jgi:hypothetical protein
VGRFSPFQFHCRVCATAFVDVDFARLDDASNRWGTNDLPNGDVPLSESFSVGAELAIKTPACLSST